MITNRTILILNVLSYCILFNVSAQDNCNKSISNSERNYAVSCLETSKRDLLGVIDNLSPDQWNFKTTSESWSIAEVCEHVLLVEEQFFKKVTHEILISEKEVGRISRFQDEEFMKMVKDRMTKVKTSPEFEPQLKFKYPNEFIKAYKVVRGITIKYIAGAEDDLRGQLASFSPNVGDIDAYQWFLFISAHNDRHTAQIQEIKEELNFPDL